MATHLEHCRVQRRATRHNMLQGVGQLKIPEQLKEDIRDKLLEEGAATEEDAATATVSIQTKYFVFYHYIITNLQERTL